MYGPQLCTNFVTCLVTLSASDQPPPRRFRAPPARPLARANATLLTANRFVNGLFFGCVLRAVSFGGEI